MDSVGDRARRGDADGDDTRRPSWRRNQGPLRAGTSGASTWTPLVHRDGLRPGRVSLPQGGTIVGAETKEEWPTRRSRELAGAVI
jgi:hypothetical protein